MGGADGRRGWAAPLELFECRISNTPAGAPLRSVGRQGRRRAAPAQLLTSIQHFAPSVMRGTPWATRHGAVARATRHGAVLPNKAIREMFYFARHGAVSDGGGGRGGVALDWRQAERCRDMPPPPPPSDRTGSDIGTCPPPPYRKGGNIGTYSPPTIARGAISGRCVRGCVDLCAREASACVIRCGEAEGAGGSTRAGLSVGPALSGHDAGRERRERGEE